MRITGLFFMSSRTFNLHPLRLFVLGGGGGGVLFIFFFPSRKKTLQLASLRKEKAYVS